MISQDLADEDAADERATAAAAVPNPAFDFSSRFGGEAPSSDERRDYEDEEEWEAEGDVEPEVRNVGISNPLTLILG